MGGCCGEGGEESGVKEEEQGERTTGSAGAVLSFSMFFQVLPKEMVGTGNDRCWVIPLASALFVFSMVWSPNV